MRSLSIAAPVLVACVSSGGGSTPASAPAEREAATPASPESEVDVSTVDPASAAMLAQPLHEGRVLLSVAARPEWATLPIRSFEQVDYHMTWKLEVGVDPESLPAELRDRLIGAVDLHGPAGKLCTVTLDAPVLQAHVLPADDDGLRDRAQAWAMIEQPGEDDQVLLLLLASFAANPDCEGALWARDARLPPPTVLRADSQSEEARALIAEERASFLDSELGEELARNYAEYLDSDPHAPPWSEVAEGRGQVWIDGDGDAQLVVVSFAEGLSKPCFPAPNYASARPLGREVEQPWPWPLRGHPRPVAVFDADLDGSYEMLFHRPWGGLVDIDLIGETLRLELSLPDQSWLNC